MGSVSLALCRPLLICSTFDAIPASTCSTCSLSSFPISGTQPLRLPLLVVQWVYLMAGCPPAPAYHSPCAPTHLGTVCLSPGCELLSNSSLSEDVGSHYLGEEFGLSMCTLVARDAYVCLHPGEPHSLPHSLDRKSTRLNSSHVD